MSETSRTLLTEHVDKEPVSPDKQSYSIIACRLAGMGGFECYQVKAENIDGHYVLMKSNTVNGFNWEIFGVVDVNHPAVALERMYAEAKRLAEERALRDKNNVLDLTSRVNKIIGDDKYFVPDRFMHRIF